MHVFQHQLLAPGLVGGRLSILCFWFGGLDPLTPLHMATLVGCLDHVLGFRVMNGGEVDLQNRFFLSLISLFQAPKQAPDPGHPGRPPWGYTKLRFNMAISVPKSPWMGMVLSNGGIRHMPSLKKIIQCRAWPVVGASR